MDLDLVMLGTAASVPTARRGLASMLLRRGGHRILFDCGEGTQRQLMRSVGLGDIDLVLITHAHADHVLGLPGMLKTFGLREREAPLTVVGPPGFNRSFQPLNELIGRLPYDLYIEEATEDWAYEEDDYVIEACPTEHSTSSVAFRLWEDDRPGRFDIDRARDLGVPNGPLLGRLQRGEDIQLKDGRVVASAEVVGPARPGRKLVYSGDTRPCPQLRDFADRATVLVHEATFLEEDVDRADQTMHSTARDAALTAVAADVGLLVLTHLSTRYRVRDVRTEASEVFDRTHVASDFDLITVPYPEHGEIIVDIRGARSKDPQLGNQAASTAG